MCHYIHRQLEGKEGTRRRDELGAILGGMVLGTKQLSGTWAL